MTAKPAKKKAAKPAKVGKAVKPVKSVKSGAAAKPKPAAKAAAAPASSKASKAPKAPKGAAVKTAAKPAAHAPAAPPKPEKKTAAGAVGGKAGRAAAKAAPRPVPLAIPIPPLKLTKGGKSLKRPPEPRVPEPPPVPVKSSLTKKELEQFRRLLQNKHRDFTEAYRTSKGDSRTDMSTGTEDYIDYAVSSYSKEFLLSLTEMDRKQVQLVQDALRRIDRNEYGLCLQCGQEIPRKRLEVQPWARHCVRCQELEERGLLRPAGHPADGEEYGEDSLEISDEEFGGPLPSRRVEEDDDEEEEEEHEDEEEEDDVVPAKIEAEVVPIVVDEDEEEGEPEADEEE